MIYDEKICLCFRVQSDHFDEFFAPELDKHGYQALYKKKTTGVYIGTYAIYGCATFFRRDRFSHVKKYEVEFNKAAQSLTDVVVPITQKKAALSRLLKDNVALIAVLEAKFSNHGADTPGKRQVLCVFNRYILEFVSSRYILEFVSSLADTCSICKQRDRYVLRFVSSVADMYSNL
ncbi:carbon catabolite repressor protein 4 homolog 1-like [Papaver somniferum]|uniref:carbon catabolite repressor protein 4 homolog 1-like n=1 Tax=Papaver somniferum TaxID=3469 RepID=UPI000E6F6D21|nr:carbon catabolite repressor protein 4 homolog 1-like [Papaver somniferum]